MAILAGTDRLSGHVRKLCPSTTVRHRGARRVAFAAIVACLVCGRTSAIDSARAEDRVVVKTETYTDSDHTTVVRPVVGVAKDLGKWFVLDAAYSVDAITTASIDVVTHATTPEFTDRREEANAKVTFRGGSGLALGGSVSYSTEADYESRAVSFQASRDLFDRNTTLNVDVGHVHDTVRHVTDNVFSEPLEGLGYAFGIAQVVSRRLVVRGGYEGASFDGFQQSPYRAVRFGPYKFTLQNGVPRFDGVTATRRERHPDTRLRHSVFVGAAWHFGRCYSLQPKVQVYSDDWGVASQTAEIAWLVEPREGLVLRAHYRFYRQTAADFWEMQYVSAPESYPFYSADKRLGRLNGHLAGVRAEYMFAGPRPGSPFARIGVDAKVDVSRNEYLDYLFLDDRQALVVQLGLFTEM